MKLFLTLSALIAVTYARVPYNASSSRPRISSIATATSQVMDGYVSLNIYFRLRFGLANTINSYVLNFCIPNLSLIFKLAFFSLCRKLFLGYFVVKNC